MHIAVCDDNVADRKQLERLLRRESDRRANSGDMLYTDSFGSSASLLANPMQYDIFYVDMCQTEGETGVETTKALLGKGVKVPIVLCCSRIDYRHFSFPDTVSFLNKPINSVELSATLDRALEIRHSAIPMIELRDEKNTYYVTEPDILYAEEDGIMLNVTLNNGHVIRILSTAENFFSQLEDSYPTFFSPSMKKVVNGRYIRKFGFRKVEMTDGADFKVSGKCMNYAKQVYRECHEKKGQPSI